MVQERPRLRNCSSLTRVFLLSLMVCLLFNCIVLLLYVYDQEKQLSDGGKYRVHVKILSGILKTSSNVKDSKLKVARGRDDYIEIRERMNATHIYGLPMEPVNANYTRNIYFTVKTSSKFYTSRMLPLLLSWLQVVDKNKVSIISDSSPSAQVHVDTMRRAGFSVIDTNCSSAYSNIGLCCKLGAEFGAYYEAIDKHPGEEDNYQWYCHVDDDMYINAPELSQFLLQYDAQKPYYFGRWPGIQRGNEDYIELSNYTLHHMSYEANHTLKQIIFRYATGATFCISYAIMMEAKRFFNGQTAYLETYSLAHLPDDMTVGLTIGTLLGYNLTEVINMKTQYDGFASDSLKDLSKYLSVSYSIAFLTSLNQFASSMNIPHKHDPRRVFLLYHCLLYPTVSWCQKTKR